MGFEFKLLFTNNVDQLNAARAALNEAVLDSAPTTTNIKHAIREGMKAVELVNNNVEGVIRPISTFTGVSTFIALGYGAITAFSGLDENGNDGTAYWAFYVGGGLGAITLYLKHRIKSLMEYNRGIHSLIKDAADYAKELKEWEDRQRNERRQTDFIREQAERQHNYAIDYMTQQQALQVNTQNQLWEAEKRSLVEQIELANKRNAEMEKTLSGTREMMSVIESLKSQLGDFTNIANMMKAEEQQKAQSDLSGLGAPVPNVEGGENLGGTVINGQ